MKVRKLMNTVFPMCALLTVGLVACEEKNEAGEVKKDEAAAAAEAPKPADAAAVPGEAAKPAEPVVVKEPPAPPPDEVCAAVVKAIEAKDEAKLLSLSTPSTPGALGAEGAKEAVMTALGSASCGAAKVDGINAMVTATAGEVSQELPFVKVADVWKFDAAGYLTKYPPVDKSMKHKAAKTKEHIKAKMGVHGKKHHK